MNISIKKNASVGFTKLYHSNYVEIPMSATEVLKNRARAFKKIDKLIADVEREHEKTTNRGRTAP